MNNARRDQIAKLIEDIDEIAQKSANLARDSEIAATRLIGSTDHAAQHQVQLATSRFWAANNILCNARANLKTILTNHLGTTPKDPTRVTVSIAYDDNFDAPVAAPNRLTTARSLTIFACVAIFLVLLSFPLWASPVNVKPSTEVCLAISGIAFEAAIARDSGHAFSTVEQVAVGRARTPLVAAMISRVVATVYVQKDQPPAALRLSVFERCING
jgi:hypothetical protein